MSVAKTVAKTVCRGLIRGIGLGIIFSTLLAISCSAMGPALYVTSDAQKVILYGLCAVLAWTLVELTRQIMRSRMLMRLYMALFIEEI